MFEGQFKTIPHRGVDDEVYRGVDNEESVVDTGQAEVPVRRSEGVRTVQNLVQHEELSAVENNSGNVADYKDNNNTDQDSCQVELSTDSPVSCLLMRVSRHNNITVNRIIISHFVLYPLEYPRVKEYQSSDR